MVRIKTAQEMGLSEHVQPFEDGLRTGPQSGNYEWWYFDSKYPDGSSLVVIFFSKPVTSMANKFQPYVSFDFLSPTHEHIHTEMRADEYSMSKEHCDVQIGESYIKGDLKHYDIHFKNNIVEAHITLDASVPSWRPYSGHLYFNEKEYFAWCRPFPKGLSKQKLKRQRKALRLAVRAITTTTGAIS